MANAWNRQFPTVRLSAVTITDGLRKTSRKSSVPRERKDKSEWEGSSPAAALAEKGEIIGGGGQK